MFEMQSRQWNWFLTKLLWSIYSQNLLQMTHNTIQHKSNVVFFWFLLSFPEKVLFVSEKEWGFLIQQYLGQKIRNKKHLDDGVSKHRSLWFYIKNIFFSKLLEIISTKEKRMKFDKFLCSKSTNSTIEMYSNDCKLA